MSDRRISLDDPGSDRDLASATSADRERVMRNFFEKLDAATAYVLPPPPPAPLPPARDVDRRAAGDRATVRSAAFDDRPSPPPAPAAPAPSAAPSRLVPAPPVVRAPAHLVSTALAVELPAEIWAQRGRLPFKQVPAGTPPPPQGTAKTTRLPVMGLEPGRTAPVGDDSITKAVAAALPFVRSTLDGGVVPFPRLTLAQYTSLCAELCVSPERSGAILLAYHVPSEAGRAALDAHWRKELAARTDLRAAFEKDHAAFTAYLRSCRA